MKEQKLKIGVIMFGKIPKFALINKSACFYSLIFLEVFLFA